jgi:hypothetical protein
MLIGKAVYAVSQVVRALLWLSLATISVAFAMDFYFGVYRHDHDYSVVTAVVWLAESRTWQAYCGITFVLMTRRVLFRLLDREVN